MQKVDGKPYLRTKIALRVIVWWPFCDFFFKNLIPALVKLMISFKDDMSKKVIFSTFVTLPMEKVYILR